MSVNLLRRTKRCLFVVGFFLAFLQLASFAHAQSDTGSVTGFVTDASGAVVPNAQVVAHNLDTNVNTPATTNAAGLYRIDFLPVGHYQISVDAMGFDKETLPPFTLEVLQIASFNVKLQVGSAAVTVNVSAAAPILNTNDPTIGTTFSANAIQNIHSTGLISRRSRCTYQAR